MAAILFALTILASAFLLFQVQPIIGKQILPAFGGSSMVWTICMVFFQSSLFAGYAYAHLVASKLRPRQMVLLHTLLVLAALLVLPLALPTGELPFAGESPAASVLLVLLTVVGLPFMVLSSTNTIVQYWFARSCPGRSPFPLYALSNAGSLIALVSYPFLVEPLFDTGDQAWWWSAGYLVFAVLIISSGFVFARQGSEDERGAASIQTEREPGPRAALLWMSAAALGSYMLLATTNHLTTDVASLPLLWILPLIIYLVSFILTFESDRFYKRGFFAITTLLLAGLTSTDLTGLTNFSYVGQIVLLGFLLFSSCMLLHGELAAARPEKGWLTRYYLMISAGGAIGGLLVGLVFPLVTPLVWEFHLGVGLVALLAGSLLWKKSLQQPSPGRGLAMRATTGAILAGTIGVLAGIPGQDLENSVDATRNFYGSLRVLRETGGADGPEIWMAHGNVRHGLQLQDPGKTHIPTAYYSRGSGVGLVMDWINKRERGNNVALIGLGVGTLATYGRVQDTFHFLEINPAVTDFAKRYFTFLSDSKAAWQVDHGDGRLLLQAMEQDRFDLLVLDAFSGDSIPVHLLTREAFDLYANRLAPGGFIAVHISNDHLELAPVVATSAQTLGLETVMITKRVEDPGESASRWVILGPAGNMPATLLEKGELLSPSLWPEFRTWTDSYSNILGILR